jgi:hypothetical protein
MSDDPLFEEERVRALLRRSDGPMLVRPLPSAAPDGGWRYGRVVSALAFSAVMVASAAVGAGVIKSLRQQPVALPAPTVSAAATVNPSGSPAAPSSGSALAGFESAEAAAEAAKQALEQHDFQRLVRLVAPTGWYARWYQQTQTDPMSSVEGAGWVWNYPNATWRVNASELHNAGGSRPVGDKYVTALVIDFAGWAEQRADIMLGVTGGRWFWSSLLLYRPPPLGAFAEDVVGYATLTSLSDRTVTVRFRTLGSRCCSDQSWNNRIVVLRRDDRSIYNKAGGVSASSLADSGIAPGSDVWVQFRLDTLATDGSYRLAYLVAMYP